MIALAAAQSIDFVVVGPEAPLVAGLADMLKRPASWPSARARRQRGSKAPRASPRISAAAHAIPTARLPPLHRATPPRPMSRSSGLPIVVKADGLAAGKGVVVAETSPRPRRPSTMWSAGFGAAGAEIVIEEFLEGEEASFFALCRRRDRSRSPRRRITSAPATATRAPIPAAWAPIRPRPLMPG